MLETLMQRAPNIDIYIIPDAGQADRGKALEERRVCREEGHVAKDLAAITGVLLLTTGIALGFGCLGLSESNIIMTYILGVLLSSYIADKKIYAVYSSLFSVLAFNFFFTEPYLSFKAYDRGYLATFFMLFLVGLFTATLTRKLKEQNLESAKKQYRTEILLENSQKLRRCKSKKEVWKQVAEQAGKLLKLSILIYPMGKERILEEPMLFQKGMEAEALKNW